MYFFACLMLVGPAKVIGAGNGLARTKRIGTEQKVPPDVCALGLKDCPR